MTRTRFSQITTALLTTTALEPMELASALWDLSQGDELFAKTLLTLWSELPDGARDEYLAELFG